MRSVFNRSGVVNLKLIEQIIKSYVAGYSDLMMTKSRWGEPLVTYADALDPGFAELKQAVGPGHAMPQDLLPDAKTVVAYFIPFTRDTVKSNISGREASRAWAVAYIETNQLIKDLNQFIYEQLLQQGYTCSRIPPTHNFDKIKLISDWSHRHVARIAGLGTFGLNNMLITEKGCCGRIGSLVTNLKIDPTPKRQGENCLHKIDGSCQRCVQRCVNNALKADAFDRHRCYEMCLLNDDFFPDLATTDVCGKCLVGTPCSLINPANHQGANNNE